MHLVGSRLREIRTLRGLSQVQLARRIGTTRYLISLVENNRCGFTLPKLSAVAQTLGVSIDYLFGLADTTLPTHQLARDLTAATTRVRELEDQQAKAGAADAGDYIGLSEFATAAGGGAVVDDEQITGRLKFHRAWLDKHGLIARECRVIQVLGQSMEPTLADGGSILVNQASRRRRAGRIYVVRTEDGLIVKRAGKSRVGAWQLVSDNPDKETWPTRPWPATADVVGEVVWTARTLR